MWTEMVDGGTQTRSPRAPGPSGDSHSSSSVSRSSYERSRHGPRSSSGIVSAMDGSLPPEPAHRLPDAAKAYWRAQAGLVTAPLAFGSFALIGLYGVLVVLAAAAITLVLPEVRYRRWRYEI